MRKTVVVTSIQEPTRSLKAAVGTLDRNENLIVIGDRKSPRQWELDGAEYYDLDAQSRLGFRLAPLLPMNHYARKNLGYLIAWANAAGIVGETDDDNAPSSNLFAGASLAVDGRRPRQTGWVNVYRAFTAARIWPRGFPLELVAQSWHADYSWLDASAVEAPMQQMLADGDTDVDAIYRLIDGSTVRFTPARAVLLGSGQYCPTNSQSTLWWPAAACLMYLPSYVSFRMTDIWRSWVAQVCLHAVGCSVAFHAPRVVQERNPHDLLKDFESEIPGYLNNRRIVEGLASLTLNSSPHRTPENMMRCYERLVAEGFVPAQELALLDAWLTDIRGIRSLETTG